MKRLLITGAAGRIGSVCRNRLSHLADTLRLTDIADMGDAAAHEEIVPCDLADKAAVEALVDGCDGVIHLAGHPREAGWPVIREANIDSTFNLYEAARKTGKPRIVFASSNHVTGFYKQTERIDGDVPVRPDRLYGVSKVFGEALASMYHDKFGIETASVRIGSWIAEPSDRRKLATWLSPDDFISLIERIFAVPVLGCPVIYGASANDVSFWDNSKVAYLGWQPQDNSEAFRAQVEAQPRQAPDDPVAVYQGGIFTTEDSHKG